MVHVIVGYGEVGKGLGKVIGKHMWTTSSKGDWRGQPPDVLHICFPYSDEFESDIKMYQHIYEKALVIVHSSVPVGTCDALGVVHSPIRGVHPHLEEGIRTFVKYFGGKNAKKAAQIFKDLGLQTKVYKEAKTTEALKLWDTTQYGALIRLEKIIYNWCQEHGIDFNAVYTQANKDYNAGYTELHMEHVVRPYLKHMPGPIGGHCVLPNEKLLGFDLPEEI